MIGPKPGPSAMRVKEQVCAGQHRQAVFGVETHDAMREAACRCLAFQVKVDASEELTDIQSPGCARQRAGVFVFSGNFSTV